MAAKGKRILLDSSGNLYPAIATQEFPQVYRISIEMITRVDIERLRQAVMEILPKFPVFCQSLGRGCFWHYLEKSEQLPLVRRMQEAGLEKFSENGLQFRFLCEGNWIHLEVFHALTDGTGAIHFLHACCYRYCQLVYCNLFSADSLEKRYGIEGAEDMQDAYQKFNATKGDFWKILKKKPAYRLASKRVPNGKRTVCSGQIFLSELKEISCKYHVTVCEFLTAVVLYILWQEHKDAAAMEKRMIRLAIPVNLRKIFHQRTERNFFTCISVEIDPEKNYTLENMLAEVKKQFSDKCTEENLRKQIEGQVSGQRNLLSRVSPVVLQDWFLRKVYQYNGYSTMVISNLGKIQPLKEFEPFILGYRCVLPVTKSEPEKIAICSYRDTLVFTVTSILEEVTLQRKMVKEMERFGMAVKVQPEYTDYDNGKKEYGKCERYTERRYGRKGKYFICAS